VIQTITILYGPPGTGKTYSTTQYAVSIIENKDLHDIQAEAYQSVKGRYDEYKASGQIDFVTFHQSMSYEDFIEGIKPVMQDDDNDLLPSELQYEIKDGIFKEIARTALDAIEYEASSQKEILIPKDKLDNNIHKLSLGNSLLSDDDTIYQYCMDNDCIAIGYGDDLDFSGVTSKKDIRTIFKAAEIEFKDRSDFAVSAMERFILWMKKDDLVFISEGTTKLRAIGVITGDYYFDASSNIRYTQFKKVKWLYKNLTIPVKDFYQKKFSQQTIYQLSSNLIDKVYFTGSSPKTNKQNYVLIIDEINRGNIAQIFGELITLLEPNKRKGEDETIETILPYSKKAFSIPNNLFVLGTMNTADRSIEALDTALRRRFSFIEIAPNEALINDIAPYDGDIDLSILLTAINARIEILLDRDHKIGHSYFLTIENDDDLINVFSDKVIPLLGEYFFGDLSKIALILGDTFIETSNTAQTYPLKTFSGIEDLYLDEYNDKKIYKISSSSNWDFKDVYAD